MTPAPVGQQAGETPASNTPSPAPEGDALLADILNLFGTKESHDKARARAAKARRDAKERRKNPAKNLGVGAEFNYSRTGYIKWKAIGRVARFVWQECACGAKHLVNVGELYELENGLSHTVWQRPEGYDIEAPSNLPIRAELLEEVRPVSICAECAAFGQDPITAVLNLHASTQGELFL